MVRYVTLVATIPQIPLWFQRGDDEESHVSESLLAREREERRRLTHTSAAVLSRVDISAASELEPGLRQRIDAAIVSVSKEIDPSAGRGRDADRANGDPGQGNDRRRDPDGLGRDPDGRGRDPYGRGRDPDGRGQDHNGRGQDHNGRGQDHNGRGQDPDGRGQDHNGRGRDHDGRGQDHNGRGQDHDGRGRDHNGRGEDHDGQESDPVRRGRDPEFLHRDRDGQRRDPDDDRRLVSDSPVAGPSGLQSQQRTAAPPRVDKHGSALRYSEVGIPAIFPFEFVFLWV
jgi:hypothetical protein